MKKIFFKTFCLMVAMFLTVSSQAQTVDDALGDLLSMKKAEAVDLGLSVNWASWNVGANSPSESGKYFAWAEIGTKGFYEIVNYLYNNSAVGDQIQGSNRDASTMLWGDGWRMPTREEVDELLYKCKWEWTERDGVVGNDVTGPNGNSIFIPAAGYINGGTKMREGLEGFYWSGYAMPDYEFMTIILSFIKDAPRLTMSARYYGLPIRPVKEVVKISAKNQPKGSGTAEDPYLIENGKHYRWFTDMVNTGNYSIHGKLMKNISNVHKPIGSRNMPFNGELDGNGHKVTLNLVLSGVEGDSPLTGMFLQLGPNAYVHDLKVEGDIMRRDYDEFELKMSRDSVGILKKNDVLFGGPTRTVIAEQIPAGYIKGLTRDKAPETKVERVDVKVKITNEKW